MTKEEVEKKCYDYYVANGRSINSLSGFIAEDLTAETYDMLDGDYSKNKASYLIVKWNKEVPIDSCGWVTPTQYDITIDTFKRAESNMTLPERMSCVKFNIDKYNWRNKGQDKEDLEKIIAYANWGLKQLKK